MILKDSLRNCWVIKLFRIIVNVDESNQISIELKIVVRYGLNVRKSREVQDIVRLAAEKTIDINLKTLPSISRE